MHTLMWRMLCFSYLFKTFSTIHCLNIDIESTNALFQLFFLPNWSNYRCISFDFFIFLKWFGNGCYRWQFDCHYIIVTDVTWTLLNQLYFLYLYAALIIILISFSVSFSMQRLNIVSLLKYFIHNTSKKGNMWRMLYNPGILEHAFYLYYSPIIISLSDACRYHDNWTFLNKNTN